MIKVTRKFGINGIERSKVDANFPSAVGLQLIVLRCLVESAWFIVFRYMIEKQVIQHSKESETLGLWKEPMHNISHFKKLERHFAIIIFLNCQLPRCFDQKVQMLESWCFSLEFHHITRWVEFQCPKIKASRHKAFSSRTKSDVCFSGQLVIVAKGSLHHVVKALLCQRYHFLGVHVLGNCHLNLTQHALYFTPNLEKKILSPVQSNRLFAHLRPLSEKMQGQHRTINKIGPPRTGPVTNCARTPSGLNLSQRIYSMRRERKG